MSFRYNMNVLGKKTEKYKLFLLQQKKKVKNIDTDGNESVVIISYPLKFIDSAIFMATWLSNYVDNLEGETHKVKCKDFHCFLEYERLKDKLIKYKCLSCNKDYLNKIDKELKMRFKNTFKFSNVDINKCISLLRKVTYPYEYMENWEKFNETSLREKEEFYSNLNMGDITNAYYMHAKRVCKDIEIKKKIR